MGPFVLKKHCSGINRPEKALICWTGSRGYAKPRIGQNKFGGESVTYMGVDAQKKWSRIESYGPKFVENIVQAVCEQMGRTPTWIPGLVLKADGYECAFYKKA